VELTREELTQNALKLCEVRATSVSNKITGVTAYRTQAAIILRRHTLRFDGEIIDCVSDDSIFIRVPYLMTWSVRSPFVKDNQCIRFDVATLHFKQTAVRLVDDQKTTPRNDKQTTIQTTVII
jgi:hypothetical protein